MEEGKLEKIAKPIIGIILMIFLAYTGLSILLEGGEKITKRMEERAIKSRQNAETKKKIAIEEKAKESSIKKEPEIQKKPQEEQAKIEQEKVKKETSKECQFWRLQKTKETSDRADKKIKENCGFI